MLLLAGPPLQCHICRAWGGGRCGVGGDGGAELRVQPQEAHEWGRGITGKPSQEVWSAQEEGGGRGGPAAAMSKNKTRKWRRCGGRRRQAIALLSESAPPLTAGDDDDRHLPGHPVLSVWGAPRWILMSAPGAWPQPQRRFSSFSHPTCKYCRTSTPAPLR